MTPDTHTTKQQDAGRYEDCIVAFLDILGFKSKVLDSEDNADTLENIIQSLKIVNAIPSGGKKVTGRSGATRTIQIRSRFFSDSLVFLLKENPDDIAQLFFVIRYLQDQLWQRGICPAGALLVRQGRGSLREVRLALVGVALLATFVLVRGISFDLLDLRVDLAGVKVHEVLEAAGIALVAWSAAIFQRSS